MASIVYTYEEYGFLYLIFYKYSTVHNVYIDNVAGASYPYKLLDKQKKNQ